MREVTIEEFAAARADGAFVVDVREADEFAAGHVPGAVLLPADQVAARLDRIPRQGPVFVICASGNRSAVAAAELTRAGRDARSVRGGTSAWQASGRPVVRSTRSNVA